MNKKKGLGKGLDSIFSENSVESGGGVTSLRISDIEPKADQPRKNFDSDSLRQLAESISVNGVLQPILVRETDSGYYQIIAGERRWRASKLAGKTEIPAIIMEADELRTAEIALIENLQRENLNAYEEAQAYESLITQFGLSQEEASHRVGKSRSAVTNSLRLLELPDEIVEMLKSGELSAGHCRAILGLRDRKNMLPLATKIGHRNLSVRETESTVKSLNRGTVKIQPAPEGTVSVNYYEELEKKATDIMGRRCRISGAKGRRFVRIEYADNSDLEDILVALCGKKVLEG